MGNMTKDTEGLHCEFIAHTDTIANSFRGVLMIDGAWRSRDNKEAAAMVAKVLPTVSQDLELDRCNSCWAFVKPSYV